MRFRDDANLDTSQVSDRRGGLGTLAVGGGGVVGVLVLIFTLLTGGNGASSINLGGTSNSDLSGTCKTGNDANQREDCRIVGVINSVQAYWAKALPGYTPVNTVFFTGQTPTGCGTATSDVGPFYCPVDKLVYIDLGFYNDLRTRFGANGGPFAEAYVIAHEYGHHVQDLQGTLDKAAGAATGPTSQSVKVELQADCLAGMWAKGAVTTKFIEDLTEADIRDGLDAAAADGDDRIQSKVQGRVDPETFTHGTAEQRQRWFMNGYNGSGISSCDTFNAPTL